MPMSFDGAAASSSGWSIRPKVRETGSIGSAERTQSSLLIGHYAMAAAGHREPCESRGSRTVLGAPGGESPLGDSTYSSVTIEIMNNRRSTILALKRPTDYAPKH